MKKKICFVLSIVLLVSAMVFSLVGCNNVKPYTVENKENTLFEIWDTWANGNFTADDKTLGVDATINVTTTTKDSKVENNVTIIGGISTKTDAKNAFKVTQQSKVDGQVSNSNIIIINQEALYTTVGDKTYKNSSVKIPDLSTIEIPAELKQLLGIESLQDVDIAKNFTVIKGFLLPLISDAVDADTFIITPVKNGKTYDVTYTFSLSIEKLITKVIKELDTLNTLLPPELAGMIGGIKEQLNEIKEDTKDINVDFTIKTTGNTMTKDKKTKAYSYTGGRMSDFEAKLKTEKMEVVIKADIKITNVIPQIVAPENAEEMPIYPTEPDPEAPETIE